MKTIRMMVMGALVVLGTATAPAQATHFVEEFLGQTRLGNFLDADTIEVRGECPSRANPKVKAVRIEVHAKTADIDYIAVKYGNGNWDQLHVRERFGRGDSSRYIDLPGGERCIEKIRVIGDGEGFPLGRQALVQVYGLRVR